jgi:hypothetical protein
VKVTESDLLPIPPGVLKLAVPCSWMVDELVAIPLTVYSFRPPPGQAWNLIDPETLAPVWVRETRQE